MKPNNIPFSQADLQRLFQYVDGVLVRKQAPAHLAHLLGKAAGCKHKSGYTVTRINGTIYPAHRLVWVYHYGAIDAAMQIDHINGIKADNRVENLRVVTAQVNCFNRSRLKAKGYSWDKSSQKWQARIWLGKKLKYLGLFDAECDARAAYVAECKLHHQGVYA